MNRIVIIILSVFLIFTSISDIFINADYKTQIVTLSLDIQESRRREELLGEQVKLLEYQIETISELDK